MFCYLDRNTTGIWKLQEVVTQVFHSVNVDPHIRSSVETLDERSSSIVHTHLRNNLGNTNKKRSSIFLDIIWWFQKITSYPIFFKKKKIEKDKNSSILFL